MLLSEFLQNEEYKNVQNLKNIRKSRGRILNLDKSEICGKTSTLNSEILIKTLIALAKHLFKRFLAFSVT